MLKMLLDPMGGIVLTNDGHAILREIEVAHPAAKSMIELSRTQDEEVGDGTTTVIILGTLDELGCPFCPRLMNCSGRDSCTRFASARTKHSPSRHNIRLQTSPSRCSRDSRGDLITRRYQQ